MEEYYVALLKCAERYKILGRNDPKLSEFITEFTKGCEDKLPLMKLNRWLGYIQGVLIERKLTTVETERNWTRPLFRPLDFRD